MITRIRSPRLAVISDLHVGNPFSSPLHRAQKLLEKLADEGFDLVINGDGLEIAQASFAKIVGEVPPLFQALKRFTARGRTAYYVVGNHDIILENFLMDWGPFKVSPFLNVESEDLRIHIEHGHLYDPFFVRYPRLYEFCTWFGGLFLRFKPNLYKLWIAFERRRSRLQFERTGIPGEAADFATAADELAQRGFDVVVFGHTHHVGEVELQGGRRYLNPGSWMLGNSYVRIENGKAQLATF